MNSPRAGAIVNNVNVPNVRIADYTVGNTTTTGTGTYTNKLSAYSSRVNPTARYYYNLDLMDKDTDAAQNLMLWSVKQYAYTDLADEFVTSFIPVTSETTTTTTISGTADMTGLSFYPVPLADGVTIDGTETDSVYGMSHIADYSDVGTSAASVDDYTDLASKDTAGNTAASGNTAANIAVPYIIRWYTAADSSSNYPARCVTSTLGYYDIELTAKTKHATVIQSEAEGEEDTVIPLSEYTYELPYSFRGLGSVGNYDIKYPDTGNPEGQNITSLWSKRNLNQYCIKLDVFTGNECTIDEDIYLNKFQIDNYFNILEQIANGDYDVYAITTTNGVTTTSYYNCCVNGDGDYDLSVAAKDSNNNDKYYYEDYYLSVFVPEPETLTQDLYHYSVISPTRFYADAIDYSTAAAPNVKSAGVTQLHQCNILIAELFKQTVETEVVSNMTVSICSQWRSLTI